MRLVVSGYFDPLHVGHLEYFQKAKQCRGENNYLIVIVNNDGQAHLKKGKPFMPALERMQLIAALRCVDEVVLSIDTDRTVCKTLASISPVPDGFCNGGDQFNDRIPEAAVCQKLGIELIDGLGDKIQSSSWLIRDAAQPSV